MVKPPVPGSEFLGLVLEEVDLANLARFIKSVEPLADRIFRGFRPKASSLREPVVRDRLLKEIEADERLYSVLQDQWARAHIDVLHSVSGQTISQLKSRLGENTAAFGGINLWLALGCDKRSGARAVAKMIDADLLRVRAEQAATDDEIPQPPVEDSGKENEELKRKLSHAKKEKRELEQQLLSIRKEKERLQKGDKNLRGRLSKLKKLSDVSCKRAEHAEALVRTLTEEVVGLRKKLQRDEETTASLRNALDDAHAGLKPNALVSSSGWEKAVEQLISARKLQSALDFLKIMTADHPDHSAPHAWLERVYAEQGDDEAQCTELLWLAAHALSTGDHRQAAWCSCRAIALLGHVPPRGHVFWGIVRKIDLNDEKRMSHLRVGLLEVEKSSAELYRSLMEAIADERHLLAESLTQPAPVVGTERLFVLNFDDEDRTVSPRQITQAVNRNDVSKVKWLRAALKTAAAHEPETAESVIQAVREIDNSAAAVLVASNTMPIVVDGSNVAHHSHSADNKPQLKNLQLMRHQLRIKGYFPVYLCVDDALRCQIDHQTEFLDMLRRGEIELADAKTDADPMIVDLAERHNCLMVTNDKMREWNRGCAIDRMRFRFEDGGLEMWIQTAG